MKFQTELDSIKFFCNQLEYSGFTGVQATQYVDQYSYYDIQAKWGKKKVRFELKRRDLESDTYNDSVIEYFKYQEFVKDITNGQIDKGYVVSFFNNLYTIDDICSEHTLSIKQAAKTTEFDQNYKINKTFVHYKQQKKFQY